MSASHPAPRQDRLRRAQLPGPRGGAGGRAPRRRRSSSRSSPTSLIGPGEPIVIPPIVTKCDYEAELGVVIGDDGQERLRGRTRSRRSRATSSRTTSRRATSSSPTASGRAASRPTRSAPSGRSSRARTSPTRTRSAIRAILNGETMQDSSTANLIFGDRRGDQLRLADVDARGRRPDPHRHARPASASSATRNGCSRPGDEITIEIDGVGSLTNPVVARADRQGAGRRPMSGMIERTVLREQVKDVLLQRIVARRAQARRAARRDADRQRARHEPGAGARGAARPRAAAAGRVRAVPRGPRPRVRRRRSSSRSIPVRAALEELAAKLATKRLARRRERCSSAELEAMRDAARRGDLSALVQHDIAFHREIVEAAGQPRCSSSAGSRSASRAGSRSRSTARTSSRDEAAELHVPILEAIRSGKPGAAGREARKHVEEFARIARRPREGRGSLTPRSQVTPRSRGCSSPRSRCARRSSASGR